MRTDNVHNLHDKNEITGQTSGSTFSFKAPRGLQMMEGWFQTQRSVNSKAKKC